METDLSNGVSLADSDGHPVALETVRKEPEYRRVRLLAENVPAVGYRVYRMKRGPAVPEESAGQGNTVENAYYRVTVDLMTFGDINRGLWLPF